MSKIQLSAAIPDTDDWFSMLAKPFELSKHSGTDAAFAGVGDNKMEIEISGKNLEFKAGALVGGTVTSLEISYDGDTYTKVTDTSLKGAEVQKYLANAGSLVMIEATRGRDAVMGSNDHDFLFGVEGNDRLNGRGGDDLFTGGMGDDRLTGGGGSDTFMFYMEEFGRDVITDFDANGGAGDQDLLELQGASYTIEKLGKHNTLLLVDGDQEVVLLDVKPSEIDASDFAT